MTMGHHASLESTQSPKVRPMAAGPLNGGSGCSGFRPLDNPLIDTTGEDCAQRQVDQVWFLAGSVSADPAVPPPAVVRTCAVPVGKSLFFPLINNFYGAFLNDPPETRTEEFVRAAASCTEAAEISVSIDGCKVHKPNRFLPGPSGSQWARFTVTLPLG